MHDPGYRFCPRCGGGLTSRCIKAGEPDRLCCDGCEFVFYLDPKLAAGAVLTYRGRVLLLRRAIEPAYGKWIFPGGFVDRGEHPEYAAAREAMEEAGVEVRLDALLGIYSLPPGSPVVIVVYHGEVTGGEPAALDESLEVGLFHPAEIPWDDLAFATTRQALQDYLARRAEG
ncbi:MAG: NUDIX domain-containing protein [Armatimonadota bacterium]